MVPCLPDPLHRMTNFVASAPFITLGISTQAMFPAKPTHVLNSSWVGRIFQSIPVHPLETAVLICKLAFLASQDSGSESL